MRKMFIRVPCFLVLLLMLAACEFPASFVIINQSDEQVDLTYAFKNSPDVEFSCDPGNMFTSPAVERAEDIDDRELSWIPLSEDEVVCNAEQRTVFIPLGPEVALKIVDHDDPGAEYSSRDMRIFPIDRLLINSPTGSVEYRGNRVLKAFTRSDLGTAFYLFYR